MELIGKKINRLTILSEPFLADKGSYKRRMVEVMCDCGKSFSTILSPLLKNKTVSCGCYRIEKVSILKDNLVGNKYTMLTVIERIESSYRNSYLCKCECGNLTEVRSDSLKSGKTKSCGCLQKKAASELKKSHGMSSSRFYKIYQGIKSRCYNPNDPSYPNYGGRGIKMQDSWFQDFLNFYNDMKESYNNSLEIDRIDFNGDYTVENCRWVNRTVGNHNKGKSNCTSNYKGVYFDAKRNMYQVRIYKDGVIYLNKRLACEIEAARLYDDVSEELYGDRPNKTKRI